MYSVTAYYSSKIAIELPVFIVIPIFCAIIVYFKIGTAITAGQFFYFYLICFLIVQAAISMGYFMSSVFAHEETAVQVSSAVIMPVILFGGFYSNSGSYMVWISWL